MKKLKKLSSKKPVVIFIYGPMAVGKLTVAKILSKKLEYKLSHNHHINDFVDEIFTRGTYWRNDIIEHLRYYLLESAVKAGINLITTHAYSQNFISATGLSDPKYVETLEKKLAKQGAKFCPVHLKANNRELLSRVNISSRKKFGKLTNKKVMREIIANKDFQTSPKLRDNFVIDNSNISPKKVADQIIKHFKLKP